jgi:radical SAM superfamily enzyme YgiQ (UPF0313 family)
VKVDLYHLYRHFEYSNFVYPIILDVLKVWAEEAGIDVRVRVCREEEVDYTTDAAVIGISVYTQTAPASYRVSSRMRALGKIVVLGGPHFRNSSCAEALAHCDVVVDTICQQQWTELLRRAECGLMAPLHSPASVIRDRLNQFAYPANFYETFKSQKWFQVPSIPTSIGCPYDCAFCSAYLQGKYKLREIETIYNELKACPRKVVFLCDATFGLNKQFTLSLMERVAPLGKKILIETSLARLRDRELVRALAKGGVHWVSIGIESLSVKLGKHGSRDLTDVLRAVIDDLHDAGILVQGNFICGLDSDGPEQFETVADFYRTSELDLMIIDLLTPYPNTAQFDSLLLEGRILSSNWEDYDYRHVVYRPRKLTPEELIDGFIQLYRSITGASVVFPKAHQIWKRSGFTFESTMMLSYNLFSRFDALRKERALRKNKHELRLLCDLPRVAPQLALGNNDNFTTVQGQHRGQSLSSIS